MAGPEGSSHPHYSPDGHWFWTGEAWLPAAQVLGREARRQYRYTPPAAPAAVPAPQHPPRRTARWQALAAAALLVGLLVAGLGSFLLSHQAAGPGTAASTPSAQSILRAPYTHHVGSATFTAAGTTPGKQTAAGEIFFAPQRAYEISEQVNGFFAQQYLDIGGYAYQRDAPGGPWQLEPTYNGEYFDLDWDGGAVTRDIAVAGPVEIDGEQAWHLSDGLGDQWWIGVRSGRPLEAEDLGYRYLFSDFGKAPRLRVPPASRVSTRLFSGEVDQPLQTPLFALTVRRPQVSGQSSTGVAPAGYRYLTLQVTVTNASSLAIGVPLVQPVLTSPQGGEYWQDPSQESQNLPDGTQPLAPGASESGTLVFDVEKAVTRLRFLLSTAELTPDPISSADYLAVISITL